ncbi:DoxX family protein [Flaviaesturariibacter amylovorans]|uniref:DoxX family protein n=1 Tax=Flaviaesturariibacter amylovorans TaxID=1084520 RepID=A0ABP8HGZ1_9BACT
MKKIRIAHWAATGLFALAMAFSAFLYFSSSPDLVAGMQHLGYPRYLLGILGTAKALGVLALLQTRLATLREWAYAGFTINLIGAAWSHAASGDPLAPPMFVLAALLATSYGTWKWGQRGAPRKATGLNTRFA